MKKNILFALCIFLSIGLFAQNNVAQTKFTLNGKITTKTTKVVYLEYLDNKDKNVKDSCTVKNGTFSFIGHVKELTPAKLKGKTNIPSQKYNNIIELYLEPAVMQIVLTENKYDKATITGSKTQIDYEQFKKSALPASKVIDSIESLYSLVSNKLSKAKTPKDRSILETEQSRLKSLFIHNQSLVGYKFIYAHPDSYLSALILRNSCSYFSLDTINILLNRLTPKVKNSRDGKFMRNIVILKNNTRVGKLAPDFTSVDINGKSLTLSSFRGKSFVLLDFWASWCGPCRSQYPHLKGIYQKYHSKGFEIIGITTKDTKTLWLKAIKDDGIGIWKQIPIVKDLNPKNLNIPAKDNLSLKYETTQIPIQILIDKNGKIVARWDGADSQNDKALDKKLKELMGF